MINFINILFYSLGVILPILIIVVALIKPSKNKLKNVLNKFVKLLKCTF